MPCMDEYKNHYSVHYAMRFPIFLPSNHDLTRLYLFFEVTNKLYTTCWTVFDTSMSEVLHNQGLASREKVLLKSDLCRRYLTVNFRKSRNNTFTWDYLAFPRSASTRQVQCIWTAMYSQSEGMHMLYISLHTFYMPLSHSSYLSSMNLVGSSILSNDRSLK